MNKFFSIFKNSCIIFTSILIVGLIFNLIFPFIDLQSDFFTSLFGLIILGTITFCSICSLIGIVLGVIIVYVLLTKNKNNTK